ncbi:MAG: KTSC domain-containing protein [Chloroflexi bacterium]|nr:KTSC domain-containing protein [Chloroflexota bacterium]
MNREPVVSDNIRSIGYDEITNVLEIEFRSGGVYQYSDVHQSIHAALMNASSKGSYFHRHIRDRYPTTRIR